MVRVVSSKVKPKTKLGRFISIDGIIGILIGCSIFLIVKACVRGVNTDSDDNLSSIIIKQQNNAQQQQRETISDTTNNKDSVVGKTTTSNKDGSSNDLPKIAYAVSVTGCGSDPITEGAAVLKHSIHRNSGIKYGYDMIAIYHPNAKKCAEPLEDLGYIMLERNTPISVDQIEGDFLRTHIEKNGCCGEKELIKLEAYTLTNYPIVVHLDLDVLILKPLDDLFDIMLGKTKYKSTNENDMFMWKDKSIPEQINAFYTIDYNMVGPNVEYKPVQGGFLVLKPDMNVYNEYKDIIKKGDFRDRSGWGGKVGPFYGSMTFQGIIPYYYNVLHTDTAIELNRCMYNQMCDNPRTGRTVNDVVSGKCRTGQDDCVDCRSIPLENVYTTHFTLCQKPWWCLPHTQDQIQHRLCKKLTNEWYKVRSEMEKSWGRSGVGSGTYEKDQFYGYCKQNGKKGYIPIDKPYKK